MNDLEGCATCRFSKFRIESSTSPDRSYYYFDVATECYLVPQLQLVSGSGCREYEPSRDINAKRIKYEDIKRNASELAEMHNEEPPCPK